MLLAELTQSVGTLHGIGTRTMQILEKMGIRAHRDLLFYLPRTYLDRTIQRPLRDFAAGEVNTIATVRSHGYLGYGRTRTLKIIVADDSTEAVLACFGRNFLARTLPEGRVIRLAGQFQFQYGELQAAKFDFEPIEAPPQLFERVLPIYRLRQGIAQKALRNAIDQCLTISGDLLIDELPAAMRARYNLLSIDTALRSIHFPHSMAEQRAARRRLAFGELFRLQMVLAMRRQRRRQPGEVPPTALQQRVIAELPFALTDDQQKALAEIDRDLAADIPMTRLLQGEVGSGKTLVALLAALPRIEQGQQAAFMVPTELLAIQHSATTRTLLGPHGLRVATFTSALRSAERRTQIEALRAGEIDIAIGTNALLSAGVEFRRLGLAIIDEQHRFGVMQRGALPIKGVRPDLLLMTATPIPRTLALTLFGDMQVSSLHSLPKGRQPIETHLTRYGNEQRVYDRMRQELRAGRQAYCVYPIIGQSDKLELRDAESMFELLRGKVFGEFRVELIHSRVAEDDKRERMERFARGEIDLLVSTSVVEVGVDVPNATCMVIEHAERFGLAALHQLRGRVGRGRHKSYAFLIYESEPTDTAKERLKLMLQETDGFAIAERDLQIRGPGELGGARQAGWPRFRVARFPQDLELVRNARNEATALVEADPQLERTEHQALGRLLALMRVDEQEVG